MYFVRKENFKFIILFEPMVDKSAFSQHIKERESGGGKLG